MGSGIDIERDTLFRRFFRPGEYTKVDAETEIGIPTMTWIIMSLSGNVAVIGGHLVRFLLQLRGFLRDGNTFAFWWSESYQPWITENWPILPAMCILWTISIPLWAFLYRMFIEQIFKQWYSVDVYAFISSVLGMIFNRRYTKPYEPIKPKVPEYNLNIGPQMEKDTSRRLVDGYKETGLVDFSPDEKHSITELVQTSLASKKGNDIE